MDKILLHQMRFYAYHGVLPEENRLGQRFNVDLELTLDLHAAIQNDDLDQTVNYAEVYELVKHFVENKRYHLIEALADDLAKTVMDKYGRIEEIKVVLHKCDPPVPGNFNGVSVIIHRKRL